MTTLCPNCNFNNPPGMRFCGNCGARLPETQAQEPFIKPEPGNVVNGDSPQPPSLEKLGVMMGSDLPQRMQQAGLQAAGQRRNITVLFADLSGYTALSERLDNEDIYELIQQFIGLLANDVYKYEGIVDKLTGDGLMALFGAPIAHENNAERAVLAALDMQADIAQLARQMTNQLGLDLSMHIGLHSGPVIVGKVGTDLLMDYTAIGDTVNLARRIEEAAPSGTTLVSETVYRQTKALFDYTQITLFKPKGITRPVTAFRLLGPKTQPGLVRGIEGLRAPMIGRDDELDQLKKTVTDLVHRKKGQFVMVTGEAGIGKSRLTSEFKASLGQYPLRVLDGQSLAYRRAASYWIFIDLFYNYLGLNHNTPQSQVRERLIQEIYRAMGSRAVEALPYFKHLLSLPLSDPMEAERLQYLEAGQLRQQIFLAVRDLLIVEARRRPLLLILDDLHWADEASLELLKFLVESLRQAPIFILAISRNIQPGTMSALVAWAHLHLKEQSLLIELQSLSFDQSEKLLSELLTLSELPKNIRELILQKAAGIPFYLEEILRMWIDEKVIQREADQWRLIPGANGTSLGVPETLQGLILARFDRLDSTQRQILQVASVIGKNFNLGVLEAVMEARGLNNMETVLPSLVEREFILSQPGGVQGEYSFRHILMSDAIYGTLLRRESSKLHGQVGETIEILYADRLESQIELLANHFRFSPQADKALHYLILAGNKAARGYANAQAQQHYEEAISLLSQAKYTPDQFLQVYMGLGDVLVLIGDYKQAYNHYQTALEAIEKGESGDHSLERSTLYRKIGITFERQGDYDAALQQLGKAQQVLKRAPLLLPEENARILNEIGWIHFRRGNLDDSEKFLSEALLLLENTSQFDVIASIYNRLGGVFFQKDNLDLASTYVQKSLALREELGDTIAVARSYNNLGLLGWKSGKWENAIVNFMRSLDLHADLGDVEGMIELNSNLGLLQLDRGDLEKARKHIGESLANAQQIGHSYHIGLNYLYLSRLYLSAKDWNASLRYCKLSLETLQEIGDLDHLVDVYTNTGLTWQGLGDPAKAREWGEKAMDLFNETDSGKTPNQAENRGRALRLLGNLNRECGDYQAAEKLLKESAAIFTSIGNQLEKGRTAMALAMLEAAGNNLASARVLLNEARLIFRQLGANLDLQNLDEAISEIVPR